MSLITQLSVANFRNYASQSIKLDDKVTLVVGPNASGKTNLLESLYTLATTRSFRARDSELIRHGEDHFRIEAELPQGMLGLGYDEQDGNTRKHASLDGIRRPLVEHVGAFQVVLFEPNDLLLIYGPPDRRRRYLDTILSQTDRAYLKSLHNYRRALLQRNRLLAEGHGESDQLFAWNLKLTEFASEVLAGRQQLLSYINARIGELYADIAGEPQSLELIYQSSADAVEPTDFLQALERSLPRDMAAGFTTIGPHRDDFQIIFKGGAIDTVASRGEIRTAVLALKMAELQYVQQQSGQHPLLLLDDVFSELDSSRRTYLIKSLEGHQAVITTTNADTVSTELEGSYGLIKTVELANA